MKKEIKDEITDIAPKLSEIGNRNPYRVPVSYFDELAIDLDTTQNVPEDYFTHLSDQVLSEVSAEKETKVFTINRRIWAAAASILLLCTVSFYTMTSTQPSENELFVLDVELDEAFEYLTIGDDLYMYDVYELGDIELWEDTEVMLEEDRDLETLLDDATLDELDDLLY